MNQIDDRAPRPTDSNADAWAVWLDEHKESDISYVAVQIAEAMDALAKRCATLDRMRAQLSDASAMGAGITDTFRGDTEHLRRCMKALIELDDEKALVPHGIGGHARGLLAAAYHRLGG